MDFSIPFVLTDFHLRVVLLRQFELRSKLLPQNEATIVLCLAAHTDRAIHLTSSVINKNKWKETVLLQ